METDGNRLSGIIAPKFNPVHAAIRNHAFTHYWLTGGRGSTKSSFAAVEAILAIKRDPNVNGIVMRKIGEDLRESVYTDILRATDRLGVAHEFHASLSPMEIVYRPTGQRIVFRGVDRPDKVKSITTRHGYFGVLWFEELDQFAGMPEIRSLTQSLLRGGERFTCLYSYNPPRSRDSWVNKEAARVRPDRMVHTSTYLDVPRGWNGDVFWSEAEELQRTDENAYRHEYLGEPVGLGGAVFSNLELRTITDDEIATFDRPMNGVDFGWWPDPWVYVRVHYSAGQRILYIFDEDSGTRLSNDATAARIRAKLGEVREDDAIKEHARPELVWCDSAEMKSIRDYYDRGVDARPVKKGPGSVAYGMKWLATRARIVIDPARCPLASDEFPAYEHKRDRNGEYRTEYPDANNHSIDSVRYACSDHIVSGW
jgi:PBSX family phage terminase large subunit